MNLGGNSYLQHKRVAHRMVVRAAAQRNYDKGLTARGTARKYRQYPELNGLHGRERANKRFKLTWPERRERRKLRTLSATERAWRELRATMVLRPAGWWEAA